VCLFFGFGTEPESLLFGLNASTFGLLLLLELKLLELKFQLLLALFIRKLQTEGDFFDQERLLIEIFYL
jgi:hypothetical protein